LTGPAFKLAGFTFIGRVDHAALGPDAAGERVNIINTVPGESIPVEYRTAAPDCDPASFIPERVI
jgi:hypothetical protein